MTGFHFMRYAYTGRSGCRIHNAPASRIQPMATSVPLQITQVSYLRSGSQATAGIQPIRTRQRAFRTEMTLHSFGRPADVFVSFVDPQKDAPQSSADAPERPCSKEFRLFQKSGTPVAERDSHRPCLADESLTLKSNKGTRGCIRGTVDRGHVRRTRQRTFFDSSNFNAQ